MFEQPLHQRDFTQELDGAASEPEAVAAPARRQPCSEGFQLPGAIWRAMFACYAIFIASLALATGGSPAARFVIAIAALFMLVYFVTATILTALGGPDRREADEAEPLQTLYGPLGIGAVRVQVLTIPAALAIFGIGLLIVTSFAGV